MVPVAPPSSQLLSTTPVTHLFRAFCQLSVCVCILPQHPEEGVQVKVLVIVSF